MASEQQQLETRVAELEHVVAQLIRSTAAAIAQIGSGNLGFHGGPGGQWGIWQRAGAGHKAIVALHGHAQRHPAPDQD
jgi:hypothetical protein